MANNLSFGQPGWQNQGAGSDILKTLVGGGVGAATGGTSFLAQAGIGMVTGFLKSLLGGLADKQRMKRKETWMSKIKPEGKYSQGKDPVIRQAISNMFATRGLKDPYEDTLGKLKGGG